MALDYEIYFVIGLTGVSTSLLSSIGGAVTEIWIKPWLKKLRRRRHLRRLLRGFRTARDKFDSRFRF
jgi:hypothetical protein